MLVAKVWLYRICLAVALFLGSVFGCAAGPFLGPSTMRCTGGATVTHYDPDYVKYECGGELVVTGSLSNNASTLFGTIAGLLAGLSL